MGGDSREPRRPTAEDVAKLAGVSQSTVSRVLRRVPDTFFSEATRKRVFQAAAELGYSPNPIARALRGKNTNVLGLIVCEIADPFFANFIAVLNSQVRDLGYQVMLGHAHSDPDEALQLSSVLDTRHCDGVLLLGDLREDEEAIREIVKLSRQPTVALCRGRSSAPIRAVNCDNRAGMYMLLDLLLGLGHRRLAFIDGGWIGDIRERRRTFIEFTQQHALQIPPEHIQAEPNDPGGGYRAMQRLIASSPRPTAVLASDDYMAFGALKAALDLGLRVPQDLSLTGFDDIELARFTTPRLTSVRQPVEEMSERALQLLLDMIDKRIDKESNELVECRPELVVRESTGLAPAD